MEVLEAIQSVNLFQQNNNLFRGLAFIISVAVDVNVDRIQILKVPGVDLITATLPPLLGTFRCLKNDIIHCLCVYTFSSVYEQMEKTYEISATVLSPNRQQDLMFRLWMFLLCVCLLDLHGERSPVISFTHPESL